MAATRACPAARCGCRRRGDSGGSGRSGTAARWPPASAAAHATRGRCRGEHHRRTTRGDCGRSCRAGALPPGAPAAPGRGLGVGTGGRPWFTRPRQGLCFLDTPFLACRSATQPNRANGSNGPIRQSRAVPNPSLSLAGMDRFPRSPRPFRPGPWHRPRRHRRRIRRWPGQPFGPDS